MREVIKVQSVKSKLVEPGYGWVRITQFQENTISELAKHLGFAAPWGLVLAFVLAWVILWWTKPGAQRMEPVKH